MYALNAFDPGEKWAGLAAELILGELNADKEPYGPAFEGARQHMPQSSTTILAGQGHLAHADDPAALGQLIGSLLDRLPLHRPATARDGFSHLRRHVIGTPSSKVIDNLREDR